MNGMSRDTALDRERSSSLGGERVDPTPPSPQEGGGHPPRLLQRARRFLYLPLVPTMAALIAMILVWWPLSTALDPFLPSPARTFEALVTVTTDGELYKHLAATLQRIAIAAVCAFFIGSTISLFMAKNRFVEFVVLPWVLIGLAIPSAAAALGSILFLGIEEYAGLIAAWVIVTPYVMNVVYEGARSIDPKLIEVSKVYQFSRSQKLRHITLPQMAPALLAGARLAFAFSWKSVVIVEALTRPTGIGSQLSYFFRLLRADNVIAYTLVFSVIMLALELLFFRTIDRRVFRWRVKTTFV